MVLYRYQDRERLAPMCFALICLLASCLPLLAGYAASSPTMHFGGLIRTHIDDVYTYLSAMHQGARGSWSYHILHTTEEHSATRKNLFYLALGKLGNALGLRLVAAYQLARLVAGAGLLAAIYTFVGYFVEDHRRRLLAFVIASVGGGLGWLTPFLEAGGLWPDGWLPVPLEAWLVEGFAFSSILVVAHGTLATAMMLITFLSILQYQRTGAKKELAKSLLLTLALAAVQPLCLPILIAALSAHLALLAWLRGLRTRPLLRREETVALLVVGTASLLLLIYVSYPLVTDPALRNWMAQNLTPSPPPIAYLWGYGLIIPLAILGAVRVLRERREDGLFLIAWLLAATVLVYLPGLPQRRFSQGVIVPMGCLAVLGMEWFFGRVGKTPRGTFVYRLTLVVTLLSSLGLIVLHSAICLDRAPPLFRPQGQLRAIGWLEANTAPEDTVLADADASAFIPAAIGHRVFWGHWCETIDVGQKRDEYARFFSIETSDDWRWDFLRRYNIRYLFYGRDERERGGFDLSRASYLRKRFEIEGYAIYEVEATRQARPAAKQSGAWLLCSSTL